MPITTMPINGKTGKATSTLLKMEVEGNPVPGNLLPEDLPISEHQE
jgi:hypothetical protein